MVVEEGGGNGGRRPSCERRGVHGQCNVYAVRSESRWREGGGVPVVPPEGYVFSEKGPLASQLGLVVGVCSA